MNLNWLDRVFITIQRICVDHYARVVEGCIAVTLIGLAFYITDERVIGYKLVLAPKQIPVRVIAIVLVTTGVFQILGAFIPLIHKELQRRGFKNRWLTALWFNERAWRSTSMFVSAGLWAGYAAVMSTLSWAAWLFAGTFWLLLTVSVIRLGASMNNADRTQSDESRSMDGVDGRNRVDSDHCDVRVEVAARAQVATASRQHSAESISYQANRERRSAEA